MNNHLMGLTGWTTRMSRPPINYFTSGGNLLKIYLENVPLFFFIEQCLTRILNYNSKLVNMSEFPFIV